MYTLRKEGGFAQQYTWNLLSILVKEICIHNTKIIHHVTFVYCVYIFGFLYDGYTMLMHFVAQILYQHKFKTANVINVNFIIKCLVYDVHTRLYIYEIHERFH